MNAMTLKFRPTTGNEINGVLKTIRDIFPDANVKVDRDDCIIVAQGKKEIAGFVHFSQKQNSAVVRGIGVVESMRGKGIGTRLIKHALKELGKKGKSVYLKVRIFNRAVNFYERNGFFMKEFGRILMLVKKPDN